jgi:hypothetical protein
MTKKAITMWRQAGPCEHFDLPPSIETRIESDELDRDLRSSAVGANILYKKIFAAPKSKEEIACVPFPFSGSRDVKPRCLSRVRAV